MKIVAQNSALLAATQPSRTELPPAQDPETTATQPGRRHIQRDLKHLSRIIRHQVKNEIKELRAAGDASQEKIQAVRELNRAFHQDLQDLFHAAGRGSGFDTTTIAEGLRQAMIDFTAALRELNGSAVEVEDQQTDSLVVDESLAAGENQAPGALLDVTV